MLDGRHVVFLVLTLGVAFLSALYITRALFIVFYGPLNSANKRAHESPRVMTLPMVLLAVGAVVIGFAGLELGEGLRVVSEDAAGEVGGGRTAL